MKKDNVLPFNKEGSKTTTGDLSFSKSTVNGAINIDLEETNNTAFLNNETLYKGDIMNKQISIDEYIAIKGDIREIKTSLEWIKWVIPLLITISIFVSGIIVSSIKDHNTHQFEMLDKKLGNIQEINSMQIQRDVAIELKKQK